MNRADRYGATPLYHACSNPNEPRGTEMMNTLLDAGADVDAKTTVALQRVAIAGETALSTSLDFSARTKKRVQKNWPELPISFVAPRRLARRLLGRHAGRGASAHRDSDAFEDDINKIYDPRGDASDKLTLHQGQPTKISRLTKS